MNNRNRMTIWNSGVGPVLDFRRDLDRLLSDWFQPIEVNTAQQLAPTCEIQETTDHFLLSLEVPGIKKDNLKIEINANHLLITGDRRTEEKSSFGAQTYTERRYGKFQRSFTLPSQVDSNSVEASYEDGLLHVLIPKTEASKPKQIKISSGPPGSKLLAKLLGSADSPEKVAS